MTDWLTRFCEAGVIWDYPGYGPHAAFQMAALHSDFYFNTRLVAENADLVDAIAAHFSALCKARNLRPAWVSSYVADIASGKVFAEALAGIMGVPTGIVDFQDGAKSFAPQAEEPVLIITDDIVSGGSLRRTIATIEKTGAIVLSPILTLGNFFGTASIDGREIASLFAHKVETWPEDDCPLCKAGSPALKTRTQWQKLFGQSR